MALADLLIQQVGQTAQKEFSPDITGAIKSGVELATHIEQVQQQREQLEAKKKELENQKIDKLTTAYENGLKIKSPGARKAYLNNYLPRMEKALGLEGLISPDVKAMIQADPQQITKIQSLMNDVRKGNKSKEEAYASVQDPELFAQLEEYDEQLAKAEEAATKFQEKKEIARIMGGMQAQKAAAEDARAGQVQVAKDVGKEFANYQAAGGKATLDKNLNKLEGAIEKLESGKVKTGQLSSAIPGLKSDDAQDILNPDVAALRDDVRGAIQGTLRQTLGAQFTAQEGESIFNRAFNPRASSKENARRIRQEINGFKQTIAEKEAEFRAQGFEVKAKPPKQLDWKETLASKKTDFQKLSAGVKAKVIEAISKQYKVSPEEVKKVIGN